MHKKDCRVSPKRVGTAWDEEKEEWYFSIVDVVGALTESPDFDTSRKYWNKTKQRIVEEGNELVTNCHQLKLKSPKDGKRYNTDVATTEELLVSLKYTYKRLQATAAIDKGMPIEQVQRLLGHEKIDTTLRYAQVKQSNVKSAHKKYIG